MTSRLASVLVACTLQSQCVHAIMSHQSLTSLRNPARSLQTTKYCGTDSLSAYLSCTADTACNEDDDCINGESCWALNCPVPAESQNTEETVGNISDTGGSLNDTITNTTDNVTTTTSSTVESSSSNTTTKSTTTSAVDTNSTSNETESSSITINPNANSTVGETSISPTITPVENWTDFDYTKFTKFCGPKHVGGFALAVSQCGPLTVCGMTVWANHYGSSGNDCPHGSMCYSDITCGNGPGPQMTSTSSTSPEITSSVEITTVPSEDADTSTTTTSTASKTVLPETTSLAPEMGTSSATIMAVTTNPILVTTRSSFCGSFYAEAVLNCGSKTMCSSSNDCGKDEECFEDVSCTYDPNANVHDDDPDGYSGDGDMTQQQQENGISGMDDDRSGGKYQIGGKQFAAEGDGLSFAQNESQNMDSNASSRIGIRFLSLLWFI